MPRIAFVCAAAAIGCADGLAAMNRVGVVFDIDGTLADSFRLGFDATNVVLRRNAFPPISEGDYHDNCIYVTPERMARHAVGEHDEELGKRLGGEFDREYIALVSTETAGFYPGLRPLLERLRAVWMKFWGQRRVDGVEPLRHHGIRASMRGGLKFGFHTGCEIAARSSARSPMPQLRTRRPYC